ncbi:oligosaccharide repeat unit polymerase [candidate division KSB1 bacterium]|nr:oligosaccharide repeat unit polymerase [candidate division KSB1 bacterium]
MFNKGNCSNIVDIILFNCLVVLLVISLLFVQEDVSNRIVGLVISILIYLILTYGKWQIYGLSGIIILAWPSVIFVTYTVIIAIPSIYITIINSGIVREFYYYSILIFYLMIPIGYKIANKYYYIDSNKIKSMSSMPFSSNKSDGLYTEIIKVLFFTCLLIFAIYLIRTPHIPIIQMIKHPGDDTMLSLLREESMKLLNVTFIEKYLFAWLRELFIPIGVAASLFIVYIKRTPSSKLLFVLFLVFGVVNNSLVLTKSPVAALFLALFGVVFLKKGKITPKFLIYSTILIFLFPLLVYMFISPEDSQMRNVFHVIWMISVRLFIVPAEALYQYFDIFPRIHDFLYGRSTKLFSWLHHEGHFNAPNFVAKIWWNEPDTTRNANAIFLGNFWADFGFIGIIIAMLIVGLIIHILYFQLLKATNYQKNIIYVALTAGLLPVFTFSFISSNFTTLLLTRGLLLIWVLLKIIQYKNVQEKQNDLVFTGGMQI